MKTAPDEMSRHVAQTDGCGTRNDDVSTKHATNRIVNEDRSHYDVADVDMLTCGLWTLYKRNVVQGLSSLSYFVTMLLFCRTQNQQGCKSRFCLVIIMLYNVLNSYINT